MNETIIGARFVKETCLFLFLRLLFRSPSQCFYIYLNTTVSPMTSFKFDPSKQGLRKTLKEYEEIGLRYVWSQSEKGVGSGKTWEAVNERLGPDKGISRASVIFFLNRMVDQGVLDYRTGTGKGGHHRIYYPKMDESEYKKHLLRTVVESLMGDFPEETTEALEELQSKNA